MKKKRKMQIRIELGCTGGRRRAHGCGGGGAEGKRRRSHDFHVEGKRREAADRR
jgi:hypothetical protein